MKGDGTQGLDREKETIKVIEEDEADLKATIESDRVQGGIQDLGADPEVRVKDQEMTFMLEVLELLLTRPNFWP